MAATNTALESAIVKLTMSFEKDGKTYQQGIAKIKLMNAIAPLPMKGFRIWGQMTAKLTNEESNAFYLENLAHPASKCSTLEEFYSKFPEETAKFKESCNELFAEGHMATQAEMVGVLQDELALQPQVAQAYVEALGFPVELTAEQQAKRDAEESENA